MKIGMGLEAKQVMGLKQVLAPRMIQSMEILQLPIAALQERIERELQENPVLELKDTAPATEAESAEADGQADAIVADGPPADEKFNPEAPLKHDATDPGAELEFKKRFDQGRFESDGSAVAERLVDERVYVE